MIKLLPILLACLLAFSATQTCGDSAVPNIQSGIITLGPSGNSSFAPTTYTQTLQGNLGISAQINYAFAIAGFQGSCKQTYYSLSVDQVLIENSNTKMRFTMDYQYNDGVNISYKSSWTRVKLTYLLISTLVESYTHASGGNYIWAGYATITPNTTGPLGLFGNGSIFYNMTTAGLDYTGTCGYLNALSVNTNAKFDTVCTGTDAMIPHYYIMGFEYAPGAYVVAAEASIPDYTVSTAPGGGVNKAQWANGGSNGWGPLVYINQWGGSIKKLKVGIVITTLLAYPTYPVTSQVFSYSGIYLPVTLKNVDRPIVKGVLGEYNYENFPVAKQTYRIFGFSKFSIASSSSCVALDIDLDLKDVNTLIVKTDNTDALNDIIVAADVYSRNTRGLCSGASLPSRSMVDIINKVYTTSPDLQIISQNVQQITVGNNMVWRLSGKADVSKSSLITYTLAIAFENFIVGNAYKFTTKFLHSAAAAQFSTQFINNPNATIRFLTEIDGVSIQDVLLTGTTVTATTQPLSDYLKGIFGLAIKTTTPVVRFTVIIPRPIDPANLIVFDAELHLQIEQYIVVYNPNTDCCLAQCPKGSGINLVSTPPSCNVCQGDPNLSFNAQTGICSCQTGYYNIKAQGTGALVCFPCLAKLCSTCSSANTTVCSTCIAGAQFDSTNTTCSCITGYYQTNGTCKICPAKCTTCQVNGVCNACSDNVNRKLDQNCVCNPGFYDDGTAVCKTCNSLCKTCTSASTCSQCFIQNSRSLVNGQCVCSSGFYQVVNSDNTVSCKKCSPQCKQCSGPTLCLDCNAQSNRIIGYDEAGHQTCFCAPGYTALKDGSCVQNGCTADPYCQDCDDARGTKVCIQCSASMNRVLAIPSYACLCEEGYYQTTGGCKPCPSGCAKCSNATVCERCAVSAINNNNGTCACPNNYFFAVQPLRYCKKCNDYCLKCTSNTSCDLCLPTFSATTSGECICPRGKYINSNLQCVSCINNCTVCASETNCTLCAAGYYVQANTCVKRCNVGYYISGVVCEKCQDGCTHCQKAGTCLVCEAGRYAYNGLCYINCPSGSIAEATNMTCLSCNAPCGNCVQHPSKCLTCTKGFFFEFACQDSCPVGTFNQNGTCTYCSFECASCVGSADTCISCPQGQYLFEGSCYAKCPIPLVNGKCPNLCPSGYFTSAGSGSCVKCNDKCKTCDNFADQCTSCASGVASNGACVQSCPANTLNSNGNCIPCAQGCNGCTGTADKCTACQSGYFLSGTKCTAACASNYYKDGNNGCKICDASCKTCSAANFCTSCTEAKSQPINGVCYSCIYPCSKCTEYEKCTACLTGFNLLNNRCVSSCPRGSTAVNGVCQCSSGVFQNEVCITNCNSGFTNINGNCQQCSSDCGQCSGNVNTCSSCKSGFVLNTVTGKCEVNTNCQYGEYFSSENRICKRICPAGYSYQDSVCVSECLSGFKDNGFGGCVELGLSTGCSFPYFYQQGSCVSSCNAGTFPNTASRVCQACSSNCFSCMSNAFCTSCNSGFDLNNNICISGARCANNKLKYNGLCVDVCPIGTVVSNGYCERRCDPNTFFLNGRCYNQCPDGYKYRTDVACVVQCQAGYVLNGAVCKLTSQNCASGQFYNSQNGKCEKCTSPCAQCQYSANYCVGCAAGSILTGNKCVQSNSCGSGKYRGPSGSCASCPAKCGDCVSSTDCSTCASGYSFNGYDCVVRVANLKEVTMTQTRILRRNNIVFVSVKLSIIPNGLSKDQRDNFFIVIPSATDKVVKVNQWQDVENLNTVIVAVQYQSYPVSTSTLFLALNAAKLSTSFENVGYTATENSFLSVIVSASVANAPSTLTIPAGVTNSEANRDENLPQYKSVRQNFAKFSQELLN